MPIKDAYYVAEDVMHCQHCCVHSPRYKYNTTEYSIPGRERSAAASALPTVGREEPRREEPRREELRREEKIPLSQPMINTLMIRT